MRLKRIKGGRVRNAFICAARGSLGDKTQDATERGKRGGRGQEGTIWGATWGGAVKVSWERKGRVVGENGRL